MNKVKQKTGRKRIDIDLKEVERLAGLGLSERQIADNLGVSWITLHRNKKRSDSFVSSLERGRSKAIGEVASALFRSATKEDPNIHAVQFYLKNRGEQGQWQDKDLSLQVDLNLNNILKEARERISDPGTTPTIEGSYKELKDKGSQ
tara:strand:+ start:448 stop:888 length:441 start_codon:yes stop_codon:yes gene_type:complete